MWLNFTLIYWKTVSVIQIELYIDNTPSLPPFRLGRKLSGLKHTQTEWAYMIEDDESYCD